MKAKWYFSTLVVALVFFGICHNQISSPNQEILLQFNTNEVAAEQSQHAISAIKHQLHSFGIDEFHITKSGERVLRISYHSAIDVKDIKKILLEKELQLEFASTNREKKNSSKPSEEKSKDYNLDVYELQKSFDNNNSAGKNVIIVKQDYDRFLNSNCHVPFNHLDFKGLNDVEGSNNPIFTHVEFAVKDASYIIPEVRAGPSHLVHSL